MGESVFAFKELESLEKEGVVLSRLEATDIEEVMLGEIEPACTGKFAAGLRALVIGEAAKRFCDATGNDVNLFGGC
jgi:hypothetical protein